MNEAEIRAGIQRNISAPAKDTAKKLKPNPTNDPLVTAANSKTEDDAKVLSDHATRLNITKLVDIYPDKSFNDAKYYFKLLPENIIETPTGQKLKRLAGVRFRTLKWS